MSGGRYAREVNQSLDMAAGSATLARVRRRYGRLARVYERSLGERLLYARARRHAVELLRLAPGATVVDIACGTGLNFPLIEEHIGPSGTLIGADLTAAMLRRASARARRAGWSNVTLVEFDVTSLTRERLEQAGTLAAGKPVDAVLCTLGMSVIPQWEAAWEAMLAIVRPGGAVAVMDGGPPPEPRAAEALLARPLVWLGCRFFAADWTREPWKLAERDLQQVETRRFSWDYVRAAAGLTPGGATANQASRRLANSNTEALQ
jgi:demethylmenaquinone methyltransferase/2-methoxy-6-polyprenyl-1,4-benzoquinol methylase